MFRIFTPVSIGLLISLLVFITDQISKWAVLNLYKKAQSDGLTQFSDLHISVLPFLDLMLRWNQGVSFSLGANLGSYGKIVFVFFSAIIVFFLFLWLKKSTSFFTGIALGLVIGGAIGNMVDRIRFGAVEDFLYVHIGVFDWWPVFNGADSAISVGACFLFIESLFMGRTSFKN